MSKISYWLLYGFVWLFTLLPDFIIYKFSSFVGFLLYYVIQYRKNLVIRNLGCSFPEKRIGEIESIAKKFYVHFADTFIESCMLLNMSKKKALQKLVIKNPEILEPFYEKGTSILAVCGHYATWDLFASLPLQTAYPYFPLYKPINNEAVDKFFILIRQKFGAHVVPFNQALPLILKNKKENKQGLYHFIADQRPIPRNIRYWTKFLNQETPVLLGVEKIAKKTHFPVVYFDIQQVKRGHYEAEIKLITEDPSKEPGLDIIEKFLRLLEATIIEKPEFWLWSHDRWKHKRFAWERRYGNFLIERPQNVEDNSEDDEDND